MDILRFASVTRLRSLSHEQLAQIAPHASERRVPAGRRVLHDGPLAQELVLIAGGRGVVRCAGETVAELGPGDVFGALAPERPAYETATVTAITELTLVVVGARALELLRAVAPGTVDALIAACTLAPVACDQAAVAGRPAPHLSLVRAAAA